jgi:hypothetical protein
MKKERNNYNPYEDETIHYTIAEKDIEILEDRKGFNDAMNHYDIINGHQIPKKLDHIPKTLRSAVRWVIILWVGSFFLHLVWSVIVQIIDAA